MGSPPTPQAKPSNAAAPAPPPATTPPPTASQSAESSNPKTTSTSAPPPTTPSHTVTAGGVPASTTSQESQARAEAAAAWRVEPAAPCSDEDDEKIQEKVLYIGNLPGPRECDDAIIWDKLTEALASHLGPKAPINLEIHDCIPHKDGRRWARLGLYRDADVKAVLSLHDTFLCDRFVKVRQTADYEIAGIGDNPPPYLENTAVCNNCGNFVSRSELEQAARKAPGAGIFPAATPRRRATSVLCRKCGNARRVLKDLVQNRQNVYNKSPGDVINHLRSCIIHPRHIHRRAYEKPCRYGQYCVRARKGACWYAHDEFERSIGHVIKFYIQNSQQPVRSAMIVFNPAAVEFTPAARRKEAELRKAVSSITTAAQKLREMNLQRDMQSDTLMQLAEECALTYQFLRQ